MWLPLGAIGGLATVLWCIGAGPAAAAGSGNPTNDKLLALTEEQQAAVLGKGIGHGCVGKRAFAMGVNPSGKAKNYAYWSLECADGRSFAVQFQPNPKGSAAVVDCAALKQAGGGKECFRKF
jgi:hypothetical protein